MYTPLTGETPHLKTVGELIAHLQTFDPSLKLAQIIASSHGYIQTSDWQVERLLSPADATAVTGHIRHYLMTPYDYGLNKNPAAQELAEDYLVFQGN